MSIYYHAISMYFSVPRPNITKKLLYAEFINIYPDCSVSYRQFVRISSQITKKKTIKTGAAECRISDIPTVIADRIYFGIRHNNVYSIDEKPFIPKKFSVNSVIVPKNYNSQVYKAIHNLKNLSPIYLIMATTYKGITLYALSDLPFSTISFNGFLLKLSSVLPIHHERCFVLIDNASFHDIDENVKESLMEKNLSITHTAPSTCFFDPIEEVFSIINKQFLELYYKRIQETKKIVPLNKESFKELIILAIQNSNRNFISIFHHAVL